MCLILFSIGEHERYKLVIAANRDEFYDRPAAPADFWEDEPSILAGKDLTAGGTWMGVSRQGRISMLTNYRDLKNLKDKAPSRGHLVTDFLRNGEDGASYLGGIPENGNMYNGYNLLAGSVDELFYQSNYSLGVNKVEPGIHGLSNELLNSAWPKVEEGKQIFREIISGNFDHKDLFEALYDSRRFPDNELPDTGVGIEMERMLSPMFIKSPAYGSRCSTVITVDWENRLRFAERTYDLGDFSYTDREFDLLLGT